MTFNIEPVLWYNTATVKSLDWLLIHGGEIKGGNPYSAIAAKVLSWHKALDEHFDYMAMGHFHHSLKICETYVNGCMITDDDWSRSVVGRDGECCQLLLAVSAKGIEAVMPIWLNDVGEDWEEL